MLGVWALIFLVAFFAVFAVDLPDTSKLYEVKRQPSVSYLDRSGALVGGARQPVRAAGRPRPAAALRARPPSSPSRTGGSTSTSASTPGASRAPGLQRDLTTAATLRGGSTITQQLARNLFLTPDQTYRRKAQELILAVWLERKFSKKQILALYLNRVNFGGGAYGIEAAVPALFQQAGRAADPRRGRAAGRP